MTEQTILLQLPTIPLHVFCMPHDKSVAVALQKILTLSNQEVHIHKMSRIFSLPDEQEPILIIWSLNCGPTQERNWLMKFDEVIAKNRSLIIWLIEVGHVRSSFINYLTKNGAKYLSLSGIVCDFFLLMHSQFKPQPIYESEQLSLSIKRNLGHGLAELKDHSKHLSNILPWLENYLRE